MAKHLEFFCGRYHDARREALLVDVHGDPMSLVFDDTLVDEPDWAIIRLRSIQQLRLSWKELMWYTLSVTKRVLRKARIGRRSILDRLGSDRNGVFTRADAVRLGVSSSTLAYHARAGTIERLAHGVYRLTNFPSSPTESLVAVAAGLGPEAIVSHESALKLYGVSDVAPSRLHFTIPRRRRYVLSPAHDVTLHTTTRDFAPGDVVQHDGFRATSLTRSIVDAARTNTAPERIVMAVREGLRRGLLTKRHIRAAMESAPARVRRLIEEGASG